MSPPPRKFTFERNREIGLEMLRLYESGVGPKELAQRYGMDTETVWHRINLGRRTRARASKEEA